jgi:hypothetical protein
MPSTLLQLFPATWQLMGIVGIVAHDGNYVKQKQTANQNYMKLQINKPSRQYAGRLIY